VAHSKLSPWISLAITQPAHSSGAVGAPDDLLPVLFECVSHTGTEGGSVTHGPVALRGGLKRRGLLCEDTCSTRPDISSGFHFSSSSLDS